MPKTQFLEREKDSRNPLAMDSSAVRRRAAQTGWSLAADRV